jgi:hypothetical protein
MEEAPGLTVVVGDGGSILGSAKMGPNRPGRGIQFNAVVETNRPAVHLWQSLGFEINGTVPGGL